MLSRVRKGADAFLPPSCQARLSPSCRQAYSAAVSALGSAGRKKHAEGVADAVVRSSSSVMRAPCRVAISLTIARPEAAAVGMACPSSRWKRSKMRLRSSTGMLGPSSLIDSRPCAAVGRRHRDRDPPALLAVADRVVDQVVDQLAQAVGVRIDQDRCSAPSNPRSMLALDGLRHPFHADVQREGIQVQRLQLHRVERARLVAGQRQQLPHQARQPVGADIELRQRMAHPLRVVLPQRHFDLRLQAG